MSILASDVITRVRAILKESASGDILSAPNALLFLSDGLLKMRDKPQLFYDDQGTYYEHADVTDLGQTIYIDIDARPALVDYVVARAFQSDANLQNHAARAGGHMNDFRAQAKVV
jgi:hypothetical protein